MDSFRKFSEFNDKVDSALESVSEEDIVEGVVKWRTRHVLSLVYDHLSS